MRFSITAMSGVAAVLLASTAPATAQDTLKIGLVMTLSGQFADAAGILDDQLDLLAADRFAVLFDVGLDAVLHLNAGVGALAR